MLVRFASPLRGTSLLTRARTIVLVSFIMLSGNIVRAGAIQDRDRTSVINRFLSLKNLEVEFGQTSDYTPSKEALTAFASHGRHAYQGRYDSSRRFCFLDGCARFEDANTPETLAHFRNDGGEAPSLNVFLASRERTEIYTRREGMRATGLIANPSDLPLPSDFVIDVALGLRANFPKATWLDEKTLRDAKIQTDPAAADQIIVTVPSGVGPLCSWFCRMKGDDFQIMRYTYADSGGTIFTQIDCENFEKVEGAYLLPFKITAKYFYTEKDALGVSDTTTITVRKYSVNAPENTPEKYLMVWPIGTNVFDQRTRETFLIRSKARVLDDDFISSALQSKLRESQNRLDQIATQPAPATQP